MDWTSFDQEYCTDGSQISYPELVVEGDSGGSSGGDTSGGTSGGGDGGSDSASDPNDPTNGPTEDPYEPPAEPDPAPLDDPATKAEVEDLIRQECKDVPGIALGSDLSGFFQSSVRRSINASIYSSSILPRSGLYRFGGEPGYLQSGALDGYALSYTPDGKAVVTGILEVKFSEDLNDAIERNQSEGHILDLGSAYVYFPPDQAVGAPLYEIVTLYQGYQGDTDVDWLGREDRTAYLKDLANQNKVNLAHLRIVNDNGSFFLKGRTINTPRETDGRNATRIPFYVDCRPEN